MTHNEIPTNRRKLAVRDNNKADNNQTAKNRNVNAASAKDKVANRGAVASMAAAAKRVAVSKPDDKTWWALR